MKRKLSSEFIGGAGKHLGLIICTNLLSIIPFFGLPNAICIRQRWFAKHTYIVGMKLEFNGKAGNLLGQMFKWGFFSVITLGIYALVLLPVRYRQWVTANTSFAPVY